MTPEQRKLVQDTFEIVYANADATGELFYKRLFELDPQARALFKGDMKQQAKVLMNTLKLVVRGINDLPSIVPAIQALGKRHAGYHVKPEQYDTVGQALLWAFEQGLGEGFTPEAKEAWTAAYHLVSGAMIEAQLTVA